MRKCANFSPQDSQYTDTALKFLIKYRLVFIMFIAIAIWLDLAIFTGQNFVGIYSLAMVFFGLIYPRFWVGLTISLLITVTRFLTIDVELYYFLFQWLSYLAIWYAISSLVNQNIEQEENLIRITTAFANTLDSRDKYTAYHSENVSRYAGLLAQEMGLSEKECNYIRLGGLLHDIGKIGIPEYILNKPTKLTQEEYKTIKNHPVLGYNMIKDLKVFKKNGVLDAILYHHEREDGTGYPFGLRGEEIPMVAKIMAVADSFDAMTSKRKYRDEHSFEYAVNEIVANRGNWYCPKVVDVFERIIKRDGESILVTSELKLQSHQLDPLNGKINTF